MNFDMNGISQRTISQILILILLYFLGSLIFRESVPYLSGVLGAVTLYVLLGPLMERLKHRGWKDSVAALVLMLLSFFCILVPVGAFVLLLINKIGKATKNSEKLVSVFKSYISDWEARLGIDLSSELDFSQFSSALTGTLKGFLGGTATSLIAIGIMYFLLYYMLIAKKKFQTSLITYIPLKEENLRLMGEEIRSMVRSNAFGIPMVALAQGVIGLVGFLLFGVKDPFFWAFVVTIGSMVPIIGAFVGIAPVFILALAEGNMFQAWGILLYGIVVVGATDNLVRLFILKRLDNVHPLITLIGVIIGVPIFGFIGLIFGPLLISLFLLVAKIYRLEYGSSDAKVPSDSAD